MQALTTAAEGGYYGGDTCGTSWQNYFSDMYKCTE
jgi:hypothetical protein